jgi:hypothetical protein
MATTGKILANGQLPAAKATLYTVPALTRAIIRNVTMANVVGGNQTVVLYIKKSGGTSRKIGQALIEMNEFAHEEGIETLEAGDEIEGETTNAASVDYTILGVEQA